MLYLASADGTVDCVYRQWFLEVFLGPYSNVNDRIMPMSDAVSSEGPKTTGIQQRSLALSLTHRGTLFLKYSTIILRTLSQIGEPLPIFTSERLCLSNGAFPLHGTAWYGSLLGGFPLGTVPGTTSAVVLSEPYHYQNVMCKLC